MKKAGRVSLLTLVVIVAILVGGAVILLLAVPDSPESAASSFMTALAKGDVNKLVELSDMGDESPEQAKKEWTFTTQVAGKYYQFFYNISGSKQSDPTDAVVMIRMTRNPDKVGAYADTYQIPLLKKDGKWKVDVRAMDRNIYPGLPE